VKITRPTLSCQIHVPARLFILVETGGHICLIRNGTFIVLRHTSARHQLINWKINIVCTRPKIKVSSWSYEFRTVIFSRNSQNWASSTKNGKWGSTGRFLISPGTIIKFPKSARGARLFRGARVFGRKEYSGSGST